jgi:ferritin-like metal-binding protein YciE
MFFGSLAELYLDELKTIYSSECQQVDLLPTMAGAAGTRTLHSTLDNHLSESRDQVRRLEKIFDKLGVAPFGKRCLATSKLADEGHNVVQADLITADRDAALIVTARRVEKLEMVGYWSVLTHARVLGHRDAADLLQESLTEEQNADRCLGVVAKHVFANESLTIIF